MIVHAYNVRYLKKCFLCVYFLTFFRNNLAYVFWKYFAYLFRCSFPSVSVSKILCILIPDFTYYFFTYYNFGICFSLVIGHCHIFYDSKSSDNDVRMCFISLSVKAGCAALPPLLTLKQMMQQRQCSSVWSAKDELPVCMKLASC